MQTPAISPASSHPHALPIVRVGIPLVSGELFQHGIASGLPLMFSANAFSRVDAHRRFVGFRLDAAAAIPPNADCALDSAGFVAASVFGDYRFSVDQYLDLVATRPWTFYSAMDYCVEPQIAPNAAVRRLRLEATISRYWQCANRAEQRGLPRPLPILQGYFWEEYAFCAEQFGISEDARLVGIGSVCRRHLHGPDGVLAIVQALDKVLPLSTKLHYFGLKGTAASALLGEFPHRFGSSDSMAWDLAVRRACPTGRTQVMRAAAMMDWHTRETGKLREAPCPLPRVPLAVRELTASEVAAQAVGEALGDLLRTGDIEYGDATRLLTRDAATVQALLAVHGADAFEDEEPEDDFGLGVVYTAVRDALIRCGYLFAVA